MLIFEKLKLKLMKLSILGNSRRIHNCLGSVLECLVWCHSATASAPRRARVRSTLIRKPNWSVELIVLDYFRNAEVIPVTILSQQSDLVLRTYCTIAPSCASLTHPSPRMLSWSSSVERMTFYFHCYHLEIARGSCDTLIATLLKKERWPLQPTSTIICFDFS